MKTYITEVRKGGTWFAGPRVQAESWAEAEQKAWELRAFVVGCVD